jgi:hypothetical protein
MFGEGGTEERLERIKKKRRPIGQRRSHGATTHGPATACGSQMMESVREVERAVRTAEERNALSTLPVPDVRSAFPHASTIT